MGVNNDNRVPTDILEYERGWTDFMNEIWREKIKKLRVYDTGNLYRSLQGVVHPGPNTTIEHKFLLYGIYVAAGVGHGFEHGNRGDLPFLGAAYRQEHGLDKPKAVGPAWSKAGLRLPHDELGRVIAGGRPLKPRDWYVPKYRYSLIRLGETEANYYGSSFQDLLHVGLAALFGDKDVGKYRNVTRSL